MHLPGVEKAGGFTITSTPRDAATPVAHDAADKDFSGPCFELAIGKATSNPAAAWLWRDESEIVGQTLQVRVGGRFNWPPGGEFFIGDTWEQVVMVAAGMGIK